MLKLGVQLHLTPALSKACHPHCIKEHFSYIIGVLYMLFLVIDQQLSGDFHSREEKRASVQSGKLGRVGHKLVFSTL